MARYNVVYVPGTHAQPRNGLGKVVLDLNISTCARGMVVAGYTNAEIAAYLEERYPKQTKPSYAAWYRAALAARR